MDSRYKKVLSYIWPFTSYVASKINGRLEVTWYNGEKILDTENANYSFGSLQRILEFGLNKIPLSAVDNILVLGLGGGSVLHSLRNTFKYSGHITAIELDPVMIQVAAQEFEIQTNENTHIICEDAFTYVKKCTDKYDLIIVDLFIDTSVVPECFNESFWEQLTELLTISGAIIFNAGMQPNLDIEVQSLKEAFKNSFGFSVYNKVEETNCVLIAEKTSIPV